MAGALSVRGKPSHAQSASRSLLAAALLAFAIAAIAPASTQADVTPFVPNDPLYPSQWNLSTQATGAQVDANVPAAWAAGWTGKGVLIGICEPDVVDGSHPDLIANYAPQYNLGQSEIGIGSHATSCAGIAAGVGGNGIGISGAAPCAQFCSLDHKQVWISIWYDDPVQQYDSVSATAATYRNDAISIKSWSEGLNMGFGTPCQWVRMPNFAQALHDSESAGVINVRCAQNSRANANWFGDKNLSEQIVVGAVGSNGVFSDYSDYGSDLTCCAPSNSAGQLGIVTTTTNGGYVSDFGGTSAATPLVSGILALAKEAQPNLNTRFAKHLLAMTCKVIDPTDCTRFAMAQHPELLSDPTVLTPLGQWHTNAAGIHFNNDYGFGLIDAGALVAAAQQYSGVTPLVTKTTGTIAVGAAIPEDGSLSRTFTLPDGAHMEDIMLDCSLTGRFKASIEMLITSPSGTTSLLNDSYVNSATGTGTPGTREWTYLSNAFWGEDPAGTWTVTFRDLPWLNPYEQADQVIWNSFGITANEGELIQVPEPATVSLLLFGLLGFVRRRSI